MLKMFTKPFIGKSKVIRYLRSLLNDWGTNRQQEKFQPGKVRLALLLIKVSSLKIYDRILINIFKKSIVQANYIF